MRINKLLQQKCQWNFSCIATSYTVSLLRSQIIQSRDFITHAWSLIHTIAAHQLHYVRSECVVQGSQRRRCTCVKRYAGIDQLEDAVSTISGTGPWTEQSRNCALLWKKVQGAFLFTNGVCLLNTAISFKCERVEAKCMRGMPYTETVSTRK